MRKKILVAVICCCVMPLLPYAQEAQSQQSPGKQARPARNEAPPGRRGPEPSDVPGTGIGLVSSEFRFGGKVVRNAPYAAEAVTESTQVLANGTKLAQKTTALIFRDGEGRKRREQSAAPVGPFATSGAAPRVIFISAPVAGVAYTLYPDTRHTPARASADPAALLQRKCIEHSAQSSAGGATDFSENRFVHGRDCAGGEWRADF